MSFGSLSYNNGNKANCCNCGTSDSNPVNWGIFEGCFCINSSIVNSLFNLLSDLFNIFCNSLCWSFIWLSVIELRDSFIRIDNMTDFFLSSVNSIFDLLSDLSGHFLNLLSYFLCWVLSLFSDLGCFLFDNLNCLIDLFSNITHIKN